jgi:hypothetical protein
MLPKYHLILGILFSLFLIIFFGLNLVEAGIVFFSSFLIDVDHYLLYVFKKKDLNLKNAVIWFKKRREKWINLSKKEKNEFKRPIYIFHGIEFFSLLIISCFFNFFFFFILIGFIFHILIDLIEIVLIKDSVFFKMSIIYTFLAGRGKKRFFI